MSIFKELQRRNVIKVGIAYVVIAWLVAQVLQLTFESFGTPDWAMKTVLVLLATGAPIAILFAWVFEMTPEGLKRESEVDRSESITNETGQKLNYTIMAVLTLALAYLAFDKFVLSAARESAAVEAATQAATAQPVAAKDAAVEIDKSIAVLPFADLSQTQDQEWFADGLAEEILNALVRVPDLQVAARTSSFQYKGSNKNISAIASELGVAHVLEGSVRSSSDRIRVTAQLIRASDGFHLWSETYDRDQADMITIQEDLARDIATTLETSMDPEALAEMSRVGTDSIEAYQSYLRGLQHKMKALSLAEGNDTFVAAYREFEQARTVDPNFADAHVHAADYWKVELSPTRTDTGSSGLKPMEALREYHERIGLAIQNAKSDADRIRSLADRAGVDLRLNEAVDLFKQYLELRPNDEQARFELLTYAAMKSDHELQRSLLEHWRIKGKTDLFSASAYMNDAYRVVDASDAADFGLQALQRWPNSSGLIYQTHRTLVWAERFAEASRLATRYETLVPGSNPLVTAREACAAGDRAATEHILTQISGDRNNYLSSIWLLHNMLGNTREEAESLRELEQTGVPYSLATFLGYHKFDPRPYPSLMAILKRENINRAPPVVPPFQCPPPK